MKPQIITAIPLPFTADGQVEAATYRRSVEYLEPHIDGILVAGTTGEFLALDDDERLDLFTATAEVLGPERTIAHLGHASSYQVIRLAKETAARGVRRMALITPYYLPTDDDGLVEFYRSVTAAVPEMELYAYLFPERTGLQVSPETLGRIMALPGIVGVKLSGAANDQLAEYAATFGSGQELYSGNDATLPQVIARGGHGVVSGVSSVFPELFSRLSRTLEEGADFSELQQAAEEVVALTGPNIRFLKVGLQSRVGGEWHSRMSLPTPSEQTVQEILRAVSVHS